MYETGSLDTAHFSGNLGRVYVVVRVKESFVVLLFSVSQSPSPCAIEETVKTVHKPKVITAYDALEEKTARTFPHRSKSTTRKFTTSQSRKKMSKHAALHCVVAYLLIELSLICVWTRVSTANQATKGDVTRMSYIREHT